MLLVQMGLVAIGLMKPEHMSKNPQHADIMPPMQGTPMELRPGRLLRFAASTRQYRLNKSGSSEAHAQTQSAPSGGFAAPPPPKRQRADSESTAAGPSGSDSKSGGLSSLANYSDGPTSPGAAPHPQPSAPPGDSSAEGRFAKAVKYSTTVQQRDGDDGGEMNASAPSAAGASGSAKKGGPARAGGCVEPSRRPSWLLTQQPKAKSGGLYGTLPPPTSNGTAV